MTRRYLAEYQYLRRCDHIEFRKTVNQPIYCSLTGWSG